MKKFIFLICAISCCAVFARQYGWDTPPRPGQLYMTYNMYEKNKLILIVTHYNPNFPICQHEEQGWHEVRPQDILKWFNDESKILYLPTSYDARCVIGKIKDFITKCK